MKIFCATVFLLVLFAFGYCDYRAYRQRYPQAAPWTFFFQHR